MQFPDLDRYPYLAYDTETTGLNYPVDRVFGFTIATPDGRSEYWDIRQRPDAWAWFARAISDYQGRIICHNAFFDYRMTFATGIVMPINAIDDTQIRAAMIDEHLRQYSLDALSSIYLNDAKISDIYEALSDLYGGRATRSVQMVNLHRAPPDVVAPYAMKDSALTLRLWEWQEEAINRADADHPDLVPLRNAIEFERQLMPRIIMMGCTGIRVDLDAASRAVDETTKEIDIATARLKELTGRTINVNSSPQIKDLFQPTRDEIGNWVIGNVVLETTGGGGPSLDAAALRALGENDERAHLIGSIRSLIKTRDTFLSGHVIGHSHDGRVYPSINQTKGEGGGTGTGRLSYQAPALQQIPSRNKTVARIVKSIFLPEPGQQWLDIDESSFEVRVFAHLAGKFDDRIIKVYDNDPETDFHQYVADLTNLPRSASYAGEPNAKQLNLSMIFNAGNGHIAFTIGKPWWWDEFTDEDDEVIKFRKAGEEAMEVINNYHRKLPGVKRLMNAARSTAAGRGFVQTFKGRRIRFPRGRKAHKASGLLIQSTAAEYNKENIMMIGDYLDAHGGSLLLNTHDSYSMSIPDGSYNDLWPELRRRLEAPGRARVPLLTTVSGVGDTWWNALTNTGGVDKRLT